MYTPDDPEHYLRRDFDGNDSICGVPFLDGACSVDCGNYIIYGHYMIRTLKFSQEINC